MKRRVSKILRLFQIPFQHQLQNNSPTNIQEHGYKYPLSVIFEKKYELARQALGVYARIPDADFRYVYLMALKLIQERIKDREENSGSNKMLASGYDLHEIEKDEELIRWMCVGYPYIIERMRPNEHRYTHKTAHFNVFYAITLLKNLGRQDIPKH